MSSLPRELGSAVHFLLCRRIRGRQTSADRASVRLLAEQNLFRDTGQVASRYQTIASPYGVLTPVTPL
ncbi:MAG: hypothetical protein WB760_08670 [Xanthobacteraceae bacterium]